MSELIAKNVRSMQAFAQGVRAVFKPIHVRNVRLQAMGRVSDREAIASDWNMVGNDVREAIDDYAGGTKK